MLCRLNLMSESLKSNRVWGVDETSGVHKFHKRDWAWCPSGRVSGVRATCGENCACGDGSGFADRVACPIAFDSGATVANTSIATRMNRAVSVIFRCCGAGHIMLRLSVTSPETSGSGWLPP